MFSTLAMFCQNQPLSSDGLLKTTFCFKTRNTKPYWILDQIHFGNQTSIVGNTEVGGDGEIGVLI